MSGGDFENYKFVMLPESGGHRSRERHSGDRHGRQEHHMTAKYSSRGTYRSGSPSYGGGNPHVYRGGVRQYPKSSLSSYPSSASSSSPYPSHRGGAYAGRYPTRSRGFASRGAFRGAPPPRLRGSYRGGGGYRSSGTSPIGRKPRVHPLPYAVSPVRADESTAGDADETLSKGELLARMRDAKESDNFDELYRLREYYRELKSRGLASIRVRSKSSASSKRRHNDDDAPAESSADWELEEVECIEETFDDDDDEQDETAEQEEVDDEAEKKEHRAKEASISRSRKRTAERAVGSSSSSRSTPRRRSPTNRHKEPRRSEQSGSNDGSAHKAASKRSAATEAAMADLTEDRNGRDKNGGEPAVSLMVSSKRRRRCDDSSYGEEEDEDEVEDLQFAEDSVDVEAMVKASEAGGRPDTVAEDETVDFMTALMGAADGDGEDGDGTDYELDYEVTSGVGIGESTPSLSALLTAEANRQLATVGAERRGRLYRRLLARHHERPARAREEVDVIDFRRFVPALVRALAAELPAFIAGGQPIVAMTDIESRVAAVLTDLDAWHVGYSANEESEDRPEWALEDDQPAASGNEEPMTVERRVATAVATILRHLRPAA